MFTAPTGDTYNSAYSGTQIGAHGTVLTGVVSGALEFRPPADP